MSGVGINRAAMERGVPRTILKDHISGHAEHNDSPGPAPYLNRRGLSEQRRGKRFGSIFELKCIHVVSMGYGKTR